MDRTVFSRSFHLAWPIALAACAADPPDGEPPTLDTVAKSATCGNAVFDATELCVTNPGAPVIATTEQIVTVLAADVDGDPFNDVVAASAHRIWLRRGVAGGFGAQVALSLAGAIFSDVAVGDFNGDTLPDIAATDSFGSRVVVWRNLGGFAFAPWAAIGVAANPVRILAARLNGDARSDLVVLSYGTHQAQVLLANGAPFAGPVAYAIGDAQDLALGDCNADGRPDLLYANGFGAAAQLRARAVDMFGNFGAPIVSALPLVDAGLGPLQSLAIAAGRFDADADDDAVVSASSSRLAPMRSNGACSFTPTFMANTLPVTWAWTPARLRTVDWNGDTKLDLAAPHGDPGSAGDQAYSIVPGSGAVTFAPYLVEPHTPGTVIPKDLAFTDVDGDGRLDVLVAAATGVLLETRIP